MPNPAPCLTLIQFRNHHDLMLRLGQHTVLVGPNGVGKTNILEAVRTLSVTKSYRTNRDRDTIEWGETYSRVIYDDGSKLELVIAVDGDASTKVMKDRGVIEPAQTMYGRLPTVLFSPETLSLVTGGPHERRRFLDTLLGQSSRQYLDNLLTYRKVLRERHFVLMRLAQGLGERSELDFWDQELARNGTALIAERRRLVDCLNRTLTRVYPTLTPSSSATISIVYHPSASEDDLAYKLKQGQSWDIKTSTTRWGPHRDDVVFSLDDRPAATFASRGEIRSIVLATKLAEADFLEDSRIQTQSRPPVILLDDVFSELDATRRRLLWKLIEGRAAIVTTTDQSFIDSASATVVTLPTTSRTKRASPRRQPKEKLKET